MNLKSNPSFLDLVDDLQSLIYKYLPINDIYKLEEVTQTKCKHLNKILNLRVKNYLKQLGFDEEFNQALWDSYALLSGSIILQALLNATWSESDLDIYQFNHYYAYSKRDIDPNWYQNGNPDEQPRLDPNPNHQTYIAALKTSPIERYLYQRMEADGFDRGNEEIETNIGHHGRILTIRNYTIKVNNGCRKIQVINVNAELYSDIRLGNLWKEHNSRKLDFINKVEALTPELTMIKQDRTQLFKFIQNNFDFDFLMNVYDGREVQVYDPQSLMTMSSENKNIGRQYPFVDQGKPCTVMKINSHRKHRELNGVHAYTALIHYRTLKYIQRGFKISNYVQNDPINLLFHQYTTHGDVYFDDSDNLYYPKLLKYGQKFHFYMADVDDDKSFVDQEVYRRRFTNLVSEADEIRVSHI